MHMRTKKWARPELQACPFFIDSIKGPDSEPGVLRGTWRNRFADPAKPLKSPPDGALLFGASLTSVIEFQAPHSGHFPIHLGKSAPHSEQT